MAAPAQEAAVPAGGVEEGREAAEAFQQTALRELRAALCRQERAVQARMDVFDDRLRNLDERLRALEERTTVNAQLAVARAAPPVTAEEVTPEAAAEEMEAEAGAVGGGSRGQPPPPELSVEARMKKVEASLDAALRVMFPRVEALLSQLERDGPPAALDAASASAPGPGSAPAPARALASSAYSVLGCTLLEAVAREPPERVRELLDQGADPNFARADGWTPLMSAARYARNQTVSLLLERGANPRARNYHGNTPLHYAVSEDRSGETVRLVVGGGADPNAAGESGQTPLHYAAHWNTAAATRALLAAGACAAIPDAFGQTPHHLAWSDEVRRLLDRERP